MSMLAGHMSAPYVLPTVWKLNPAMFVSGLLLMYNTDNSTLSRILDVAQEMKVTFKIHLEPTTSFRN